MSEVALRLFWVAIAVSLIGYVTFLYFGSVIRQSSDHKMGHVLVFDSIQSGAHHLKGVIVVPSKCHELSVKVREHSLHSYTLLFETWKEPNRDCENEPHPRIFETIAFAPAVGVSFNATLDGKPLTFDLLETYR